MAPDPAAAMVPTPVSLYVHVPFCVSKCAYCDFTSQTLASADLGFTLIEGFKASRVTPDPARAFVDAVLSTLEWAASPVLRDVPTVYFGGGTPTVLDEELIRLVSGVRERAGVRPDAEITVETNPETTTPELVAALVDAGVNRFSLGVQSFDDDVLRILGRAHDAGSAMRACEVLRAAGVPFSIDLICGVPGQSYASWEATLETAVASAARHVSVYPLTVEDGTPMADAVADGRLAAPDPDLAADMMLAAEVALAAAGMPRYEVANYAQPGHESRHNRVYWTGGAYVGVGPSAASMLPCALATSLEPGSVWSAVTRDRSVDERVRFTVNAALADFVHGGWDRMPETVEFLAAADAAREDVMLGLRLTEGVECSSVEAAGLTETLVGLAERELVILACDADGVERWRTTQRGWLLGNQVFGAVWAGE